MPKNIPVIKRKGLLLNHLVFHCSIPSMIRGSANTTHQPLVAYQPVNTNNTPSSSIPTASPVQRAQMGNCFPLQKKDLPGKLWQPKNRFKKIPISIIIISSSCNKIYHKYKQYNANQNISYKSNGCANSCFFCAERLCIFPYQV